MTMLSSSQLDLIYGAWLLTESPDRRLASYQRVRRDSPISRKFEEWLHMNRFAIVIDEFSRSLQYRGTEAELAHFLITCID